MKTNGLLWMGLAVVLGLSSCKRGEEDPLLPLKSRDGRITGEWKLTGYDVDRSYFDEYFDEYFGDSSTWESQVNFSFEDGTLTVISTSDDGEEYGDERYESTYKYEVSLEILKGGTYTYAERFEAVSTKSTYWEYDYMNDTYKQVTVDSLAPKMISDVTVDGYWHWKDNDRSKAMISLDQLGDQYLLELRNKKMVWESVGTETYEVEEDDYGDTYFMRSDFSSSSLMEWEKQ